MAKIGISARGERVDFDILSIKQQLASKPVAVGVDSRRKFIDTKEGIKPKDIKQPVQNAIKVIRTEQTTEILNNTSNEIQDDDLLAFAKNAAKQSSSKK